MDTTRSIDELITSEELRLFVLDRECYVLYTGDELKDPRPFIRIGTWKDLPTALIPHIENIILPDSTVGDPSIEQFQIDLETINENRYIGSRSATDSFFAYQELYGIDLERSTLVHVEEDIPELDREKSISGRDQFIGLFYQNGNISIRHDRKELLDLNSLRENIWDDSRLLDEASRRFRDSSCFRKQGFGFLQGHPFFFSNRSIITTTIPENFTENLFLLGMAPGRLISCETPESGDHRSLLPLLKWKHQRGGGLAVYSNTPDSLRKATSLYRRGSFKIHEIPAEYTIGGLTAQRRDDGSGFLLSHSTLSVTIISKQHTPQSVKSEINSGSQGLIISFSQFQKNAAFYRSAGFPLAVYDDGSAGISKIKGHETPVLFRNAGYELEQAESIEEIFQKAALPDETVTRLLSDSKSTAQELLTEDMSEATIYNILAITRLLLLNSSDRKKVQRLRELYRELENSFDFSAITGGQMVLYIFDGAFIPVALHLTSEAPFSEIDGYASFLQRIEKDRERLAKLLALLHAHDDSVRKEYRESLSGHIERRKKEYQAGIPDGGGLFQKDDGNSSHSTTTAAFKPLRIAVSLLLLLTASLGIFYVTGGFNGTSSPPEVPAQKATVLTQEEEKLKSELTTILDSDIYRFASLIAKKNNFAPLDYPTFKARNPDWIYPDNVFTMLDGTSYTVTEGDTLWDIARQRLTVRGEKIFEYLQKAKECESTAEALEFLAQAQELAVTESQKKAVEAEGLLLNNQ